MDFTETTGQENVINLPGISSGTDVGISYNYDSLTNFVVLVFIFVIAKLIFTKFLMSSKRGAERASENTAYAISVFSLFISLAFILTSVIYGNMPESHIQSVYKLITYSVLGIVLLIVSGLIFDKLAIKRFSINKEIAKGNKAAAIIDAGNFIASALIIASSLKWYEFKSFEDITAILGIYIASQAVLTIATLIRKSDKYPPRSTGFEHQITNKNTAVAIDFSGRRIATALALTAAMNILPFQQGYDHLDILFDWTLISVILVILLNILSWLASRIIFWNKNIIGDILEGNVATALGDAAVYISFGIILAGTMM
jgi:uncharacterized membrane protein YjfL (UPF0719 family)